MDIELAEGKTKEAITELKNINKSLLKNFFERDLEQLRKKTTVAEILRYSWNTNSSIRKFDKRIMKDPQKNVGHFIKAIERLYKPPETKHEGLFYKFIVKNKDELFEKRPDIEEFLIANTTSDADKTVAEDKKSKNIMQKLASEKHASVLKVFIALVAWDCTFIPEEEEKLHKESDKLKQDLQKAWLERKKELKLIDKKSVDLRDIQNKAYAAADQLCESGVFTPDDRENLTGTLPKNFVQLFIRYLDRSFPETNDYIKIIYSLNRTGLAIAPARSKLYRKRYIKRLTDKSKTKHKIYFTINQYSFRDKVGHANLTIVCDGNYRIFESSPVAAGSAVGYDEELEISKGAIQSDNYSCVVISLGYLESLVKKVSAMINKGIKDKEKLSKQFWNEINRFSTVTLDKSITGTDKHPLQVLLPSKYIKYMQSMGGINRLIEEAKKEENKDKPEWKDVADELEKVKEQYRLLNSNLAGFLESVEDELWHKKVSDIKPLLEFIDEKLGRREKATVRDLLKLAEKRTLTVAYLAGIMGENAPRDFTKSREKLSELLVAESEKEKVLNALKTEDIYKMVSPGDPQDMTCQQLAKLESILSIVTRNRRTEMKRYTEILKISTFVDVMKRQNLDVLGDMQKVKIIDQNLAPNVDVDLL